MGYGQQVAATHPTRKHSCITHFINVFKISVRHV